MLRKGKYGKSCNWPRFRWKNAGVYCAIIRKQVDKYGTCEIMFLENDTYYDNEEYDEVSEGN